MDNRITTVFLTSSMEIGGQEQYIAQQIMNINKKKFSVMLCCLKHPGPMAERVQEAGIRVISDFQTFKYDFLALWRLVHFLKVVKPDIIYIFDFRNVLFIGRLAAKLARIPLVVIASHKMNYNGTGRSYGWLDRALMPLTDHVIAAADAHRESLIEKDGIDPEMVTAIHNGIQISRLEEDLKQTVEKNDIGIPEHARIVGTVARLSPEKAQDILLDAALIVINQIQDCHLIFVGDGPERVKLEQKAVQLGINKQVHFLGFRNKVAPIVRLFNVFVLSSTATETFSAATLEAMALGIPPIVTNVGSMSEMIINGVNGYLVPANDHRILAQKMIELLNNPKMAANMGIAARLHVENNFTAEREVRQIESLFENHILKRQIK